MTFGSSKMEKLGLAYSGSFAADQVQLLVDEAWVEADGRRRVNQEIFQSVFNLIDEAECFILIDFFLINDFLFEEGMDLRPLSQDLTDHLVAKRKTNPDVEITFISDPVNTVYGSIESPHFNAMQAAGIRVVLTELNQLRDSNPIISKPWRLLVKPWGTGPGQRLANPLGEGRISLRSLLKLMNCKANHRKVVISEKSLLITSANPHSGSSAHWNTALRVDGAGMREALQAESAILKLSGAEDIQLPELEVQPNQSTQHVQLLTERKIKEHAMKLLNDAEPGARIDLVMFYFSDTDLISAFIKAARRGCEIRVILDPCRDAFGRPKNGVPNRQTAAKLMKAGIPIRWADTHGEQCHTKMLYIEQRDSSATLMQGSGNYTRRNMDNFNAECDLALHSTRSSPVMERARECFERWWSNSNGRIFTTNYETYADPALSRRIRAWLMEKTGMSTF